MTADQFQREVIDALDLVGMGYDHRIVHAESAIRRAADADNDLDCMKWMSIGVALYAASTDYGLDTIFQMALDELEENYGGNKSLL